MHTMTKGCLLSSLFEGDLYYVNEGQRTDEQFRICGFDRAWSDRRWVKGLRMVKKNKENIHMLYNLPYIENERDSQGIQTPIFLNPKVTTWNVEDA